MNEQERASMLRVQCLALAGIVKDLLEYLDQRTELEEDMTFTQLSIRASDVVERLERVSYID